MPVHITKKIFGQVLVLVRPCLVIKIVEKLHCVHLGWAFSPPKNLLADR